MKISRLAISDEGFVFDPETGNSYTVNETGLFILQKLKEGLSPTAIVEAILEEYEVSPEEAERDVEEFLEGLRRFGLWRESHD
ncbi:HPr-rel-A system PqqD family peptide chaperone [Thermosulfurimonas dismutans]|uniref:PqqD family protein n=1 Tax=Thermosulfurimonas dismutans TaxID=999894 RepID=A0A179D2R8_9BACT|nr:HPr-rel-A system PqqD family peptide chaperone [Thermosulfurimonas dismutans]OAQ20357.1 hypothetical protein TDIS_1552 [Thermosulfurimonas dismutans]